MPLSRLIVLFSLTCAASFACGESTPPRQAVNPRRAMATLGAPDTLCTTDKDCEYTRLVLDGPTVCCDGCSYKVANKRWVVEAETTCATTHTDGCSSASEHDPATCVGKPPHLSCHEGRCAAGFSD